MPPPFFEGGFCFHFSSLGFWFFYLAGIKATAEADAQDCRPATTERTPKSRACICWGLHRLGRDGAR